MTCSINWVYFFRNLKGCRCSFLFDEIKPTIACFHWDYRWRFYSNLKFRSEWNQQSIPVMVKCITLFWRDNIASAKYSILIWIDILTDKVLKTRNSGVRGKIDMARTSASAVWWDFWGTVKSMIGEHYSGPLYAKAANLKYLVSKIWILFWFLFQNCFCKTFDFLRNMIFDILFLKIQSSKIDSCHSK